MGKRAKRGAWVLSGALALGFAPTTLAQPSAPGAEALLGYRQIVVPGPILRLETSAGVIRIALFSQAAPRLTRAFLEQAEAGAFRNAGFGAIGRRGVQLGSPDTDVYYGGAQAIRSTAPGLLPRRDQVGIPFLATRGAHAFESTGLRPIPGSVLIDQRFIVDGQLFRREYFIALGEGFPRGEVVGHVISGLDVVRRLDTRDAILRVRVEAASSYQWQSP